MLAAVLALPQAASAFFCLKSSSNNKYFGRSVPYQPRINPYAAYRLPPIMPRRLPARTYSVTRRPAPPRNPTWRPVR